MNLLKVFIILSAVFILGSCGKTEKEKAADAILAANQLIEKGDTVNALLKIDTVKTFYKSAIQQVVLAAQLEKSIYADMLFRKQDELDSLKRDISNISKKFVTEKTEFDRHTQYIHKRQQFKRRWNKSFLQIHLDETGEVYLSSNYYGDKYLQHTGMRVYDEEIQAKTLKVPLDHVLNHRSDFLETKWEKVTYRDSLDNGVIQFIADNADRKLKAVFLGKRYYYIILEEYDKQAVKDALALSALLKRQIKLVQEIKNLQSKVG